MFFLIVCFFTQSAQANDASAFRFMRGIYSAFEAIESTAPDRFRTAVSYLQLSAEYAEDKKASDFALDSAMILNRLSSQPTERQLDFLKNQMRKALVAEKSKIRLKVNQIHPEETALLKNLIKAHLFPVGWEKVKMSFEGVTDAEGVALMGLYLADPRSAKYDPSVRMLLGERDPKIEKEFTPNPMRIVFNTPEEEFELPEGTSSQEIETQANSIRKLLIQPGTPIRYSVRVDQQSIFVSLQVMGAKHCPLIEPLLRDFFSTAHGNRYVFAAANKVDLFAKYLNEVAAHPNSKKIPKGAAKAIGPRLLKITRFFRERVTAGLPDKNPDSVKQKVQKHIAKEIDTIRSEGSKVIERLKQAGATESEILVARKRTYSLIDAKKTKLTNLMKEIDSAVANFKASDEYAKILGTHMKALRTLYVAEGVASRGIQKFTRVFTWDRALKGITAALAAYTIYRGLEQYSRSDDPYEKTLIWRHYGIKLVSILVYAAPVAGEAALIVDLGGLLIEQTLDRTFNYKVDLPNVEESLEGLVKYTAEVGYWLHGQTTTTVKLSELINDQFSIPPIAMKGKYYSDYELNRFVREVVNKRQSSSTTEKMQDRLVDHMRTVTQKYVAMILVIEDIFGNKHDDIVNSYISKVTRQLTSRNGYLPASSYFLGQSYARP